MIDEDSFLIDGPARARHALVLAHGAGAAMDSPFMTAIAEAVAAEQIRVVRFEFPYMAERRVTGRRRPPNAQSALLECWREVVATLGHPERLVIGGKSMGGRMASLVATELGVLGLCCLGYPFHPAGKPDRLRTEHLACLATPTLILQGERDALGSRGEVAGYDLAGQIEIVWLPDGDHSWKPRVRSGHTADENLTAAVQQIVRFVTRVGARDSTT